MSGADVRDSSVVGNSDHSDGFQNAFCATFRRLRSDKQDRTASAAIGAQMFADIDQISIRGTPGGFIKDINPALANFFSGYNSGQVIRPFPMKHDTTIIACGSQTDGGQSSDDAAIGATKAFQKQIMRRGDRKGLCLMNKLSAAFPAEFSDSSGYVVGDTQSGITTHLIPVPHYGFAPLFQGFRADRAFGLQGNRC